MPPLSGPPDFGEEIPSEFGEEYWADYSAQPESSYEDRLRPEVPDLAIDSMISRPLAERMAQASPDEQIGVIIELNAYHSGGVGGAARFIVDALQDLAPEAPVRRPRGYAGGYVSAALTADQIRELVDADLAIGKKRRDLLSDLEFGPPETGSPRWAIHRMWPNFQTGPLIHRSIVTTKCEAAQRAFNATGENIVWAVLDSGIEAHHPHFALHDNLGLRRDDQWHRSFLPGTTDDDALRDAYGHGTHVAGILAGEQFAGQLSAQSEIIAASLYRDAHGTPTADRLTFPHISGMAPRCTLLSCKVLRDDGGGDTQALLDALEYIQQLNDNGRQLKVHGVNLSVGYPFDPQWHATGLTPVCREVDRLVRSGVVVVVAAGNTGSGYALSKKNQKFQAAIGMTINDPGNAENAITVGSTSTKPHTTGVSYFSSKGPTGDGRLKPDLVAPGERIISAGTGRLLAKAQSLVTDATYVEDSGTSTAAPHVSGVAAAFLSVHREFIGRPDEVKRILLETATDIGRTRTFQGRGVVDAMRAIQSV